jgi:HEAT repeat protein
MSRSSRFEQWEKRLTLRSSGADRRRVSTVRHCGTPAAVRRNAALALGEFEDTRPQSELDAIVEPLVGALDDPTPLVRASATSALGRMKSPLAIEPLERLRRDDADELVRRSAAAVLRGFPPS